MCGPNLLPEQTVAITAKITLLETTNVLKGHDKNIKELNRNQVSSGSGLSCTLCVACLYMIVVGTSGLGYANELGRIRVTWKLSRGGSARLHLIHASWLTAHKYFEN
jgi:hypothetical protein